MSLSILEDTNINLSLTVRMLRSSATLAAPLDEPNAFDVAFWARVALQVVEQDNETG